MKKGIFFLTVLTLMLAGCTSHPSVPTNYQTSNELPLIYPDYTDVVVPPNIAPLNFGVRGADNVVAKFTYNGKDITFGKGNKVLIDESDWKTMLSESVGKDISVEVYVEKDGKWTAYKAFNISIAEEEIDQYVAYRLIFPSYVAYEMLSLNQRDLTSFEETEIYNNMNVSGEGDGQCVNCHSFQAYKTDNMQFHMRQGHGGTMIVRNNVAKKINMKNDSTISAGVYPSWHPTLPIIAYSTNSTGQSFHTKSVAKIEVQDTKSDVVIYDVDKNEIRNVSTIANELENFPYWSPDGKYLYFGSAHFEYKDTIPQESEMINRFDEVHYDIFRKPFNAETMTFGDAELIYEASADSLSATFPRISPDGRYLLVGVGKFGCFHVWHPDADLYLVDLKTLEARPLENVNSDRAESFHAWSSNGRWIVFISRRDDGNYSRLYFAYFDKQGHAHKAFEMPQADPDFYTYFMRSYNVPEFITEKVKLTPHELAEVGRKDEAEPIKFVSTPKGKVLREGMEDTPVDGTTGASKQVDGKTGATQKAK